MVNNNKLGSFKERKSTIEIQIMKDRQAPRKLSEAQMITLISGFSRVSGTALVIMNAILDDEGTAY